MHLFSPLHESERSIVTSACVSSSHFLSYLFPFTTWVSYLTFVSLPPLALLCPGILLALLLMPFIFHFIMFLPLYYIIARISIMGVFCPFGTFVLVTFCNPIAPKITAFRSPISWSLFSIVTETLLITLPCTFSYQCPKGRRGDYPLRHL